MRYLPVIAALTIALGAVLLAYQNRVLLTAQSQKIEQLADWTVRTESRLKDADEAFYLNAGLLLRQCVTDRVSAGSTPEEIAQMRARATEVFVTPAPEPLGEADPEGVAPDDEVQKKTAVMSFLNKWCGAGSSDAFSSKAP